MSRDWKKDMELCSSMEGEQWINEGKQLEEYDRLTETGCRYIATFDREEDATFTAESREALPYWLQQYAAEERHNVELCKQILETELREKKLREAIESSMELGMLEYAPYAYEHFEETLSTLYPKEETIE